MDIEIIGAESLGVRSIYCIVRDGGAGCLVDPGVSLAPHRSGLPPHRVEIEAARQISRRISESAASWISYPTQVNTMESAIV